MDNSNRYPPAPYPYNPPYGYNPHGPTPQNHYPPPNFGPEPGYPPPSSPSYPHSHYPPPPMNYPYPNPSPAPASAPHYPLDYSGSNHYQYDPYPPPATPPQPTLQNFGSFQHGSFNYHHHQPSGPPPDTQSNIPHYYQDNNPSSVGDSNHNYNHQEVTYPPIYPPIDDQLASMSLSGSHHQPSAPASPPAPASASLVSPPPPPKYHSGPLPATNKYDSPALANSLYPSASFSNVETYPTEPADMPYCGGLQLVVSPQKPSYKILLLHGNLEIWVYQARNLPNMDMFHKTIGEMINKLPGSVTNKLEGQLSRKITSDPYVSISIADATIARTFVISNNENPVWLQSFVVPVAHYAAEIHFVVKDNDVVGTQLIGTASVPIEHIYKEGRVQGLFPILNTGGKPVRTRCVLSLAIKYTAIEKLTIHRHGIGAGPDYEGVAGTYFPLRRGGTVTLYQDAHVPDGMLPSLKLGNGTEYMHGNCWVDIFDAISRAQRLIYITGWSVWHKVRLVRDQDSISDYTLGDLLKSKSQEGVRVLLLIWDDPTSRNILGYKTDGVMATHDEETRRFFKHSSVQVILCPRVAGKRHSWIKQREVGVIYTHHQKTVIVDADAGNNLRKIIAFVGGLDLCDGRYDNPHHAIFRTLKNLHSDDFHNPTYTGNFVGCPREPWHDLHCKIDGPAAYDVLTNFEERWMKASKRHGIKKLKNYDDSLLRIERMPDIVGLSDAPCLNDAEPESWHVQIFRSIDSNSVKGFPKDPKDAPARNLVCGKNVLIDMSIHAAYVKAIRDAQHFIYIENQYFIGSSYNWNQHREIGANNLIPIEIALKIAEKIKAHERFAAYIVIPMWPEGNPTSAPIQRILYWQNKTMQMMYETIYQALVEVGLEDAFCPQDFLNFFCLGNREAIDPSEDIPECNAPPNTPQGLSRKNRRFMIYVHSKGMIVDDEYVILGSANINQRSLEGTRDTEIAMGGYQPHYTWARKGANPQGQIYGYRMSLWAEHLGFLENCFTCPESLECVRRVRSMAEANWSQFAAEEVSEMKGHLLKYPVEVDRKGKVKPLNGCEQFPDIGGNIVGSFLGISENLTI